MNELGFMPPIYQQWIEIFHRGQDSAPNLITPSKDLYIKQPTTHELKTDALNYWRDLILYSPFTLKSKVVDPKKMPKAKVRYIHIVGGELRIKNVKLQADGIFPMSFHQLARAVNTVCKGPFTQSQPEQILGQFHLDSLTSPLKADINALVSKGSLTPLMIASCANAEQVVRFLLAAKANVQKQSQDGWTALKYAVIRNYPPIVRHLLDARALPDQVDNRGETVLNHAACENNWEIAELLVQAKADPLRSVNFHETPLSSAVNHGAVEILNLFAATGIDLSQHVPRPDYMSAQLMHAVINGDLEKLQNLPNLNPNATNEVHQTPLILAAAYGHVKILKFLVEKGANLDARDQRGNALTWAAKHGHADAVSYLISQKISITRGPGGPLYWAIRMQRTNIVEQLAKEDQVGAEELLIYAAKSGDEQAAKSLIEVGISYDVMDSHGSSPFDYAFYRSREKIITLFVNAGADGATALTCAAEIGLLNLAEHLIDLKVELNNQNEIGMTALMYSAKIHGSDPLIKKLIEKGARHDLKDVEGRSALSYAASYGREEMVLELFRQGAALDEKDVKGRTPLAYAAMHGHEKIAKWLIAANVSKDERDNEGRSPIQHAAITGNETIVRLFVEAHVDINQRDPENKNVLMLAVIEGHLPIVQFLLESGADQSANEIDGLTPYMHAQLTYGEEANMGLARAKLARSEQDTLSLGSKDPNIFKQIMQLLVEYGAKEFPEPPKRQSNKKSVTFQEKIQAFLTTRIGPDIPDSDPPSDPEYEESLEEFQLSLRPPGKFEEPAETKE